MDYLEIEERLRQGELLACSECSMFDPETEECLFICCDDPFAGPTSTEVSDRINLLKESLDKKNHSRKVRRTSG
jgi:hypothetical protein